MRICGIELKGSDAVFAIIDSDNGNISSVQCQTRKIRYGDSASYEAARHFFDAISGFVRDHHIDRLAIKQRNKKGPFTGGPVTFKMEGLFQLIPHAPTDLYSGPAIAAVNGRYKFEVPDELMGYQIDAYLTACCAAKSVADQ